MNIVKLVAAAALSTAAMVSKSGRAETIQLSAADFHAIAETVTGVGLYGDLGQWVEVAELLADQVTTDYTSLFGGAANSTSRAGLVRQMRATLQGFDATQHLIGNVQVRGSTAEEASAVSHVRATHWIDGRFWIVGGVYTHNLVRTSEGWQVTYMRFQRLYEEGSRAALRDAAARVTQTGGSDA
jgi:hypothetical protein